MNITLRKLARKSIWNYGKYNGCTIEDILKVNIKFLIWSYYNYDKVSFIDEILEEFKLKYKDFELIQKPGKDPLKFELVFPTSNFEKMSYLELQNHIKTTYTQGGSVGMYLRRLLKKKKIEAIKALKIDNPSKETLRLMNHGKGGRIY